MWSVLGLMVPVVSIDIGAFETSELLIQRHIVKSQMSWVLSRGGGRGVRSISTVVYVP